MMQPSDVGIGKDYVEMFPYEVDGHEYWSAWDIDSDGKPDILRVKTEGESGSSEFHCFPAQTTPSSDLSKYDDILKKFPNIADSCDNSINTRMTRSCGHLEKINDVFFKAREQALKTFDLFQDAVLNGKLIKEMVTIDRDRMSWNSIKTKFLGPDGNEMEIELDEAGRDNPAYPFMERETCYPEIGRKITSMHLEDDRGMDVYISDMRLLDRNVREWVGDYYYMSWISTAWLFNDNCPGIIYEWFSDVDYTKADIAKFYTRTEPKFDAGILEYCNTHSDELCKPDYEVSV